MNAGRKSAILALTPHAFGGHGGIARYNRDLLHALTLHPLCDEVIHLPRLAPDFLEALPGGIDERTGSQDKLCYAARAVCAATAGSGVRMVLCTHLNLLPVAALVRALLGVPCCLVLYGIEAWEPTPRLHRSLLRQVDRFVSISRYTAERFGAWSGVPPAHVSHLPNAIRLEDYGVAPADPGLVSKHRLGGRRVLLVLGRLSGGERYKGIDEILEILPDLDPDLVFVIAGDGDDRARLTAKVATLGLSERVRFTGFVPEAEKHAHYRLADVFAMPGRGEGFGFVYLEAMACGIPVVASALDGSREAVRGGALGVVVDPRDRDALRTGLLEALQRPKGVPVGLEYFSFQRFVARCHAIVDEVLDGPTTRLTARPLRKGLGWVRRLQPIRAWRNTWVRDHTDRFWVRANLETAMGLALHRGTYRNGLRRIVERLLAPGDVFIDGGAHIGYLSLAAAARVGPSGSVVAVEPNPELADHIAAAAERSGFSWLRVVQAALSDQPGTALMSFGAGDGSAFSSLRPNPAIEGHQCEVTTRLLPDLSTRRPTLVKLDLEGAELLALRGARVWIEVHRPVFILELQDLHLSRFSCSAAEAVGFMETLGYNRQFIDEDQDRLFEASEACSDHHVNQLLLPPGHSLRSP